MANNSDFKIEEKFFNSILKTAFEEADDQELASYPSKEELDMMYPRPPELDKKIMANLSKLEKPIKRKLFIKSTLRVAVIACVFIMLSALVLFNVEASRNFILNSIIDMQSDHVAFEFIEYRHRYTNEPNVLPNGFEYVDTHIFDNFTMTIYVNTKGQQIIVQQHIGLNLSTAIDSDYREFFSTELNGQNAYIFESTNDLEHHVVMWHQRGTVFQVFANIQIEELFEFVAFLMEQ